MVRCLVRIAIAVMVGMAMTVLVAMACARWSRPRAFSDGFLRIVEDDSQERGGGSMAWTSGVSSHYARYQIRSADLDSSPNYIHRLHALARWMPSRQVSAPLDEHAMSVGIAGHGVLWMLVSRHVYAEFSPRHRGTTHFRISHEMIEKQYGWPLLCLSSGVHEANRFRPLDGSFMNWWDVERDCIARYHGRGSSRGAALALDWPRAVLWPGFIANTFIFCGPWLLYIFMTEGRTWLRHRRGHCPICAYDLRSDFARGCPECGWGRSGSDNHGA